MLTIIDHGQVRELRLDRPPVNALNIELMDGLKQAIVEAGEHFDAIVISGRPGLFSAGLDVPELIALDREGISEMWRSLFTFCLLYTSPSPRDATLSRMPSSA